MEGHASLPYGRNIERVRQKIAGLVKQHEAEPAADHDAERDPEEEIVRLSLRHRRLAVPEFRSRHKRSPIKPSEQDAGHVGEAVPSDGDRSDLDGDRIDHGVWDG